jgi:hypothetical protein
LLGVDRRDSPNFGGEICLSINGPETERSPNAGPKILSSGTKLTCFSFGFWVVDRFIELFGGLSSQAGGPVLSKKSFSVA